MHVPNLFPRIATGQYRLAIVGEAPGKNEADAGVPFVGGSGRFLKALLSKSGINFDSCFVGNICQFRPFNNEIEYFAWDGAEIQSGLETLGHDLRKFQPNLVLLLGNCALKAALDPVNVHPLKPGKWWKHKIGQWRGSLFRCAHPGSVLQGYKCLASYHPAAIIRNYEDAPLLQFDLNRASSEARTAELVLPVRNCIVDTSPVRIVERIRAVRAAKSRISVDIEGYVDDFRCISIATSRSEVFIVPFAHGGSVYANEEDEAMVWRELAGLLADYNVPKCLQNSLYDRFVLQYSYQLPILNVTDDTMLLHWELYCELEKRLGVQASIYTREPFYKEDRHAEDANTFWTYCCKDSAVTQEIVETIPNAPAFKENPRSVEHYKFNRRLLNALLYMELRGIKYDTEKAQTRRATLQENLWSLQHELDAATGFGIRGKEVPELLALTTATMCYKRDHSVVKKGYTTAHPRAVDLASRPLLTMAQSGELSTLLDLHLNVDSPKQLNQYLYGTLKLPIQTNDEGGLTSNENALIKLRKKAPEGTLAKLVTDKCIQIRRLGTRVGMLSIHADRDGRIRCGYNIVGTETGRLTCYTSPTGSGYNLQTIPSGDRDLFVADPDSWFFQCDLSGADGWTIGAHCAALGDPTMLDDLTAGIKPAKVLCLGLRGVTKALDPRIPREELAHLCATVKKEDWDYFACKIGIWGICYLMGIDLLRNIILEESDGKLDWSRSEATSFQRLVFIRYQVRRWHDHTARKLAQKPVIVAASGHRRLFLGRSDEILGKALAHEPQANTTYATNLAAFRLWTDPENRLPKPTNESPGGLRIEPLHQVHDALCGQFKKTDTAWATPRIKSYFNNELVIAGRKITIPFEGHYGPSWGEQKEGTI